MVSHKYLSRLLVVFLCLFLVACSSPEEKKERYYLKALEYIKQDKPKSAMIELHNAIQIDAKYADARYQLGLLYLKENDPQKAFGELIRAADLDHDNLDANLKIAELFLMTRKKEESRKYVERILDKDPNHLEALALLANLELIEGKFDDAMAALDKIGDEVDKSDRLLNIKGRISAAREQWPDAEESFRKAITLDSEKFINYRTLLMFFESRKEIEKAKALLDETVKKFPDIAESHLLLAGYYRNTGDKDKEELELKRVVEIAPEDPGHRLLLGGFYINRGDLAEAEKVFIRARDDIKNNPELGAALAALYFDQGKFDEAQLLIDEVNRETPGHGGIKLSMARFLLKEAKVRDAIEVLEQLNKDFPKWADPYYYLGVAHFTLGETDLAQLALASALEINANSTEYHTLMAQLFQAQGAFVDSQKEATIALTLNPKNLRAALILTSSLIGAKEYDKAVEILTQMKDQVPGNLEILGMLGLTNYLTKDFVNSEKVLAELLELDPGNNRAVTLMLGLKYRKDLPGGEAFVRGLISKTTENSGLYLILGSLLEQQGKTEEALVSFDKAIELNPDSINAYVASSKLLVSLGKRDEAMARFQKMINQNKKWIPGYMGLAALLESDGRRQEAKEEYMKILEIKADYAPAANNLAWLIAEEPNGDLGEAMRLAMIAKQAFPDEAHIADTLGWVYYKRGSYSLAIPQFELALNGRPENPTLAYHLALALNGNGQQDKAVEILEVFLGREVDFPEKSQAETLLTKLKQP